MNVKRYIPSIVKVVLTFASIHLAIDLLFALKQKSLEPINLFSIIDLNFFYPESSKGVVSNILSILLVVVVFTFYYVSSKSKK